MHISVPLYMDIHDMPGATPEDVAKAHEMDVHTQEKYGVEYRKYYANHECGKVFCLVHAPSAEAAAQVHREAHGMVADKIIEVQPELAEAFLGGGVDIVNGAVMRPGTRHETDPAVRTVIFTDIVDSTALTQRLGDARAMELVHAHDRVVREALAANSGREVKHTGDGIMASFNSAVSALRCAAHIQHEFAHSHETDLPIKLRIGAAAGEPVDHGNDIFGSTVQLASRLCSHALPEQIVVSNVVAELCLGKGLIFQSLGEVILKGFDQPVKAHAVDWLPIVHS